MSDRLKIVLGFVLGAGVLSSVAIAPAPAARRDAARPAAAQPLLAQACMPCDIGWDCPAASACIAGCCVGGLPQ